MHEKRSETQFNENWHRLQSRIESIEMMLLIGNVCTLRIIAHHIWHWLVNIEMWYILLMFSKLKLHSLENKSLS